MSHDYASYREMHEHLGYLYLFKQTEVAAGLFAIRTSPKHAVLRSDDRRYVQSYFRYGDPVPQEHFRLWIDLGLPQPKLFGRIDWNLGTMNTLAATLDSLNIAATPDNLDLIRVAMKLSYAD